MEFLEFDVLFSHAFSKYSLARVVCWILVLLPFNVLCNGALPSSVERKFLEDRNCDLNFFASVLQSYLGHTAEFPVCAGRPFTSSDYGKDGYI